jgi:hypothetical protein
VTQAGDPDDHFLDPGQSIRLAPGAKALVGAEGAAQVTLLAQRPRPGAWLEATIRALPRVKLQP